MSRTPTPILALSLPVAAAFLDSVANDDELDYSTDDLRAMAEDIREASAVLADLGGFTATFPHRP